MNELAMAEPDTEDVFGLLGIDVANFDEQELLRSCLKREPDKQYQIVEERTEGGMGRIFEVFDETLQRPAAMKVIRPKLRNRFAIFEAFVREARITAQLEHPNIVPVHDLGYVGNHGSFFTMKLIDGEPLIDVLQQIEFGNAVYKQKYDAFALLGIFRKVCDAVAFAHSRGIIHRDVKPHNIMVGDYGEVLLMDWGLARRADKPEPDQLEQELAQEHDARGDSLSTTAVGVVKGSPSYMSPEQAIGDPEHIDEQSDVFLLGATLYHMFTFFPPYLGDDIYEVVEAAREADYAHPAQLGTHQTQLSEELVRVILRAMAPSKEDRYRSVTELIRDVDRLLRGELTHPSTRSFSEGEALMTEGEVGAEAYIIRSGKVKVLKRGENGEEKQICELGPGDIVGEMALITHELRSASVIAVENTEAVVLNASQFARSAELLPPWMNKTLKSLASRLQETTGHYA
jgi:serine/threonine-protein kinase